MEESLVSVPVTDVIAEKTDPPLSEDCDTVEKPNATTKNSADEIVMVEQTKDAPNESHIVQEKKTESDKNESEPNRQDTFTCTVTVEVDDEFKLENTAENVTENDTHVTDSILTDIDNSVNNVENPENEQGQESAEKEHNKSLSRELKSLMKAAKESKIINECTQVTSKMRKSRARDLSNTNLNTNEANSIKGSRRSSENSQKSNSSEKSDNISQKRSMRSQNPDFVNKQKQFLHSVTGKKEKENLDKPNNFSESESGDESKTNPNKNNSFPNTPKRQRKVSEKLSESLSRLRSDLFCWRCHWSVTNTGNEKPSLQPPARCTICPRSYHYKCLSSTERTKYSSEKTWVCPECLSILRAESSETRSPAMRKISLGTLHDLLKYALKRMTVINGVEHFMQPVDCTAFPDYDKYVVRPMDLALMEQNIEKGLYGSTEAFTADALWILHNSIVFNTVQSKLTATARSIVRTCRTEMGEIETCPECYAAAHARRPTWFTDVCSTPHILIWAKLKGFPYWPAKGMTMNASGMVDVRFFGQHDRAWVPARDCYLYCDRDPNNFRTKKQELIDSMQEAEHHISNLSRKFNGFIHAAFKTPLDLNKWDEQLKMMIPGFQGDIPMPIKVTKEKNVSNASSPTTKENRRRSNSKSSKEFLMDGDASEDDEIMKTLEGSRKMADGVEVACEEENKDNCFSNQPAEVDVITLQSTHVGSKKRRLSHLEEAVLTVIVPSEKRKRPDTPNTNLSEHKETNNASDMQNNTQTMDVDIQNSNTGEENNELNNSNNNKAIEIQKETHTIQGIDKETDIIQNIDKDTEKDKDISIESININFEDRDSNKTVKDSKSSEVAEFVVDDKMKNINEKLKFSNQKNKLFANRKVRNQRDDRNKSRVHHKINKRRSSLPKEKSSYKKNESSVEGSTAQADNSVNNFAINIVDSPDKKDNQKDKSNSMVTSTPKNGAKSPTRSVKDCILFDDDTSLAEIARNTSKTNVIMSVPGLPTISSVLSLSKSTGIINMKQRHTGSPLNFEIFTTNNKGAASKTGQTKKETERTSTARVGVRAFARIPESPQITSTTTPSVATSSATTPSATTPSTTNKEQVEVEIKTEPIDEDADRQTEKLDLLNTFRLRPVTQTTAVREPRTTKSTVVTSVRKVTTTKPTDVRPRAKKTFPQPRKPEDGRSELNSKNSMVYIPIQPPANQAPVRSSLAGRAGCSSASSKNSTTTAVTSSANIMVNTVTTPLMQVACVQPGGGSQTGAGAGAGHGSGGTPTVAPIVPTTVHTVPLIHSVNGQWTFSLQPVMSVGGSQLTNGVPERSSPSTAQAALVSALAPGQPAPPPPAPSVRTNTDGGSQVELPRLQQRPLLNPLDPTTPIGEVPTPSTAGGVTAKLNQNAVKMADFFRSLLEDSLEKLNEPLTQVTMLKLQLERERWRHQQEVAELKHNHELSMVEMRTAMEKEKARLVSETRRVCQAELDAAVNHAKSRQWCANCRQEAQFYCCWNTSYCDYPCQRAHWTQHFSSCTQQRHQSGESSLVSAPEKRLQPPDSTASSNTNSVSTPTPTLTVGGKVVPSRVYGTVHPTQNKQSIIVSMIDDGTGNQTVKCVGTYKPNPNAQPSPLLLNKQIMNTEESTKKVTPSGYIIVSGGGPNSLLLN